MLRNTGRLLRHSPTPHKQKPFFLTQLRGKICAQNINCANAEVAAERVSVYHTARMTRPYPNDTIAAIATAPGAGAIAIVRVSGPDAFAIADRLFRCPAPPPSQRAAGTFVHGQVVLPDTGEVADDALLLVFRAPHSYTGEDAVELQGHGGTLPARRILQAVLACGARQADPGEFTKRAFLNDKLDLTQAEAVLDLIASRSDRAARLATAQLDNALGRTLRKISDSVLAAAADVEAMLDFPDDELPQSVPTEICSQLDAIMAQISALLATWHEGHLVREGARVVIAGAPNVGKSTLLNLLTGRERAIVTPHPGTTRDTIEETLVLQGIPIHLTDTAGLRNAPEQIEQEGIRRTHVALEQADLCIYLVDASQPLQKSDADFLADHSPHKTLVLGNKIDLGQQIHAQNVQNHDYLAVSLKNEPKIGEIQAKIVKIIAPDPVLGDATHVAISTRHQKLLQNAQEYIKNAKEALKTGSEADYLPAANLLRDALEEIGQILGENCPPDVLEAIFSRFCVGK